MMVVIFVFILLLHATCAWVNTPIHTHPPTPFPGFCWAPCCSLCFSYLCCPIVCLYVLRSVLWCPLRFPHNNDVLFVFTPSCLYEDLSLIYVICVWLSKVVFLLCFLRLVFPMLPVSLDFPFFIAPSGFSNVCFLINIHTPLYKCSTVFADCSMEFENFNCSSVKFVLSWCSSTLARDMSDWSTTARFDIRI